jgi:hypothetical protein
VAAVIAGWLAGYVMGMASTVMLTVLAMRYRTAQALEKWLDPEVNRALLAVPIFLGAVLGWTMAGMILGAAYEVFELGATRDGLGSPSIGFTVGMVGLAWLPVPILFAVSRRLWWMWVSMALLFAGLFGWMLPHLAGG